MLLSSEPEEAEQKYLSNMNARTGERNPKLFSQKGINSIDLVSRLPVKIEALEKGGALPLTHYSLERFESGGTKRPGRFIMIYHRSCTTAASHENCGLFAQT